VALSIGTGMAVPFPRLPRDTLPYGVRTFLPHPLAGMAATLVFHDGMQYVITIARG